jgi:uncharacterized DUF497 family protein
MRYDFEWDPKKAKINIQNHRISFEKSATIFDEGHSDYEERWITIGLDENGILLVLSHTFKSIDESTCKIRIISARKATKSETKQYKG